MTEADLFELASMQYGVVSRTQALDAGLSTRQIDLRVESGRLAVVHPGVYRTAGAPQTGRQRAMAACLWLGPETLTSFVTGAALLRLDGCRTPDLHVSVPRDVRRRVAEPTITIHRVRLLPRIDRVVVDGIPCTSATRTIIDCAALLDDEALEVAFESARRMGLTSVRALALRAADLCKPGRSGSRAIRELLARQQPGDQALQYRLEVKLARLLRNSGLPSLERQVKIGPYRIDFASRVERVGVECEGFEYHGSRLAWKRDKARTAWLEAQGWRLIFVTWDDVTRRPEQTLERIAIALALVPSDPAMRGEMAPERTIAAQR